jgi:hypothetical protein
LRLPGMLEHDATVWKQPDWTARHYQQAMAMLDAQKEPA